MRKGRGDTISKRSKEDKEIRSSYSSRNEKKKQISKGQGNEKYTNYIRNEMKGDGVRIDRGLFGSASIGE